MWYESGPKSGENGDEKCNKSEYTSDPDEYDASEGYRNYGQAEEWRLWQCGHSQAEPVQTQITRIWISNGTELLELILTSDLRWDGNVDHLVKDANRRMS